jgi:hypothetical protein
LVNARLLAMGRQAVTEVATSVQKGEPLVYCQLLASEFYEALRRETRQSAERDSATRRKLISATHQCQRAALASISPPRMLEELRGVIRLLHSDNPQAPVLRVIQGGLSRS